MTQDQERQETLLEQMGGIGGLVYSTLPILVFVPVNALWSLQPALYAALGTAAAILVWRLVRGEKIQPAVSGFIGVGICAYIAHRTGTAKGYFLFGIYTSLVYGGAFLLSVLVRWPLVGVIWNALNGEPSRWRGVQRARRLYDIATLGWVVVFGARYLVQSQLYDSDQTGWLAFARIAMGWPLAAIALLVTFYAIRRADTAVEAVHGTVDDGEAPGPAAEPPQHGPPQHGPPQHAPSRYGAPPSGGAVAHAGDTSADGQTTHGQTTEGQTTDGGGVAGTEDLGDGAGHPSTGASPSA